MHVEAIREIPMRHSWVRNVLMVVTIATLSGVATNVHAGWGSFSFYAAPHFHRIYSYSPTRIVLDGAVGAGSYNSNSGPAPVYGPAPAFAPAAVYGPAPVVESSAVLNSCGSVCRPTRAACCARSGCGSSSCVSATAPCSSAAPTAP